jgi:hypothetical protein
MRILIPDWGYGGKKKRSKQRERSRSRCARCFFYPQLVQPMLVGEKVILLQNDPTEPFERLQQAARDAHDMTNGDGQQPQPQPQPHHEEVGDFAASSIVARTHDIALKPSVSMCRGFITSYQLLHHRLRKNWLLYSGPAIGEPIDDQVPVRTDPLDAIGLVRRGKTRTRSQALLVFPLPPHQMKSRLPLAALEFRLLVC